MERCQTLALLHKHNIPLETWGVGEASSLEKLFKDIAEGECALREDPEHGLMRCVYGVTLDIYARDKDELRILKEVKQVFVDGRTRVRTLEASIGEKMHKGETPTRAAIRALREELSVPEVLSMTRMPDRVKGPVPSQSFPGLVSFYTICHFTALLRPRHVKWEGYIERQVEKTNYYRWETVRVGK